MTAKEDEIAYNKETYAIVGELVLLASAVDSLLNELIIVTLELGASPMITPIVATLDPKRKIEILKGRSAHIRQPDWKRGLTGLLNKAESVFKYRNIACHTPPILENGRWALKPIDAAKLLKRLDIQRATVTRFSISELQTAISTAEAALASGSNVVENFERVNAEKRKKVAAQAET
ncbi:MAG: hypothetical protein ACREC9_15930 [Methylocella sp.]